MDYLQYWWSDGPQAQAGLILLGVLVQFASFFLVGNTPRMRGIVLASVIWHLVTYLFLAFWVVPLYAATDKSDAYGYHHEAIYLAQFVRSGSFGNVPFSLGTQAVPVLISIIYAPLGGDIYGMLFFCVSLSLLSGILFCKAFAGTSSDKAQSLYFFFVLFWPSICMWSSLLGKDFIAALGLAFASFGTSRILTAKLQQAIAPLLLGLTLVALVRPHVALAAITASVLAAVWPRTGSRMRIKLMAVVVLAATTAVVAPRVMSFMGLEDPTMENVAGIASQISEANNIGGSALGTSSRGAAGIPIGMLNLLIRPYPWEAGSLNTGFAAAENLLLLVLIAVAALNLRRAWFRIRGNRYLLYCGLLSLELLTMLSPISNAGLASRQRVQFLPFMLACIAPALVRTRTTRTFASPRIQRQSEFSESTSLP